MLPINADAPDDVFELALHLLWRLAFVRELIQVGLEGRALPLEGVWGQSARLRGGGVWNRDVLVVHPEVSGRKGREIELTEVKSTVHGGEERRCEMRVGTGTCE